MNAVQILREAVGPADRPATHELEVENLVARYLVAKESIEEFVNIQGDAKHRLRQIIEETGQSNWDVRSGTIICPADYTIVTYDAQALDRLAAASRHFRQKVFPFRGESFRSGGIRIVGR